jgi:hypothetical protein
MKHYLTGDPWTEAKLLHAEELHAEARAHAARWALLREARPPRRRLRVWLGTLLLAAGRRLIDSAPGATGPGLA